MKNTGRNRKNRLYYHRRKRTKKIRKPIAFKNSVTSIKFRKEKEIIKDVLTGLECKEIAAKRGKSVHTVRNHIRHIYIKCIVQNRVELANRINEVK